MTPTQVMSFKDPARALTSLLAPWEKRCLVWLAQRMPRWVNSDHLTGLAIAAMAAAGASYALARAAPIGLLLVVVCLMANWFGDSLDGTLARVRRHQRPRYGYYVDHVVDVLGTALLFGGLALSGYMSPIVALCLLVAYLLVCCEVYLATHCLGTFTMSFLKIGPTELRILLSFGNIAVFFHPTSELFGQTFRLFDVAGVLGAAGMGGTFLAAAVRNTRTLFRAEPIPR